jgi:hypothetical protein
MVLPRHSAKHRWTHWKLTSLLLLAIMAGAFLSSPAAHAAAVPGHATISAQVTHGRYSQVGGGGCTYYQSGHDTFINTALCVDGPYTNSSGRKYYTWQAYCWMPSATWAQPSYLQFVYYLNCSVEDTNANFFTNLWAGPKGPYTINNTPSVVLFITFPWYTAYAGTTVALWGNGYSYILASDKEQILASCLNRCNHAYVQQYLPY